MSMGRCFGGSTRLVIVALLAFAIPAWAQQTAPVAVKVIYEHATVAVQTSQNIPLTAVLEEFCRQTRTDCEGTAAGAKVELPPVNAQGSWQQVIAELMEGTGLNYAAMPATAASEARLLITGRVLSPEAPQQVANRTTESNGRAASGLSDPVNADDEASPDTSIPQPDAAAEDAAADVAPSQGGVAATAAVDTTSPDTRVSSRAGSAAPGAATDFMGNAVPPYSGPAYSPFPDGNGNLIPAGNQPITSSPFPDSNGNLMPVPKQPAPNGNPFPRSLLGNTEFSK